MEAAKKQSHLTFGDRQIIQKGIENGSSKKAIADLLGKDKPTIGTESLRTSSSCLWNVPPTLTADSTGSVQLTVRILFNLPVREETALPGLATAAGSIAAAGLTSSNTMPIMPTLLTGILSWNLVQELTLQSVR
ncbi:helix-turn-helix domain-containing protein [Galactobacillus timonensis]|uniref:helix-turn-helix domain-containing protein n=1 Tax=Galactobacillus timonensis TaxID=2041840 RepID=UPI00240A45BC|nr:helix-turn-helix domain-containing protein [Galactobacillus timonensis]MDD6680874.1 helix-turn-helix domain-containing protein [Galactobacillus timonensis]